MIDKYTSYVYTVRTHGKIDNDLHTLVEICLRAMMVIN